MISPGYLRHIKHKHRQGRAAKPPSNFQLVQPLVHQKQGQPMQALKLSCLINSRGLAGLQEIRFILYTEGQCLQ